MLHLKFHKVNQFLYKTNCMNYIQNNNDDALKFLHGTTIHRGTVNMKL